MIACACSARHGWTCHHPDRQILFSKEAILFGPTIQAAVIVGEEVDEHYWLPRTQTD